MWQALPAWTFGPGLCVDLNHSGNIFQPRGHDREASPITGTTLKAGTARMDGNLEKVFWLEKRSEICSGWRCGVFLCVVSAPHDTLEVVAGRYLRWVSASRWEPLPRFF
jgi:hypothetical protein